MLDPYVPVFMLTEALSVIIGTINDTELYENYYNYYWFLHKLYLYISGYDLPPEHRNAFAFFLRDRLFINTQNLLLPAKNSFYELNMNLIMYISGRVDPTLPSLVISPELLQLFTNVFNSFVAEDNSNPNENPLINDNLDEVILKKKILHLKSALYSLKGKIQTGINSHYAASGTRTSSVMAMETTSGGKRTYKNTHLPRRRRNYTLKKKSKVTRKNL